MKIIQRDLLHKAICIDGKKYIEHITDICDLKKSLDLIELQNIKDYIVNYKSSDLTICKKYSIHICACLFLHICYQTSLNPNLMMRSDEKIQEILNLTYRFEKNS